MLIKFTVVFKEALCRLKSERWEDSKGAATSKAEARTPYWLDDSLGYPWLENQHQSTLKANLGLPKSACWLWISCLYWYWAGAITLMYPWPLACHASVGTNCLLAKYKFQITISKAVGGGTSHLYTSRIYYLKWFSLEF